MGVDLDFEVFFFFGEIKYFTWMSERRESNISWNWIRKVTNWVYVNYIYLFIYLLLIGMDDMVTSPSFSLFFFLLLPFSLFFSALSFFCHFTVTPLTTTLLHRSACCRTFSVPTYSNLEQSDCWLEGIVAFSPQCCLEWIRLWYEWCSRSRNESHPVRYKSS